VLTYILWWQSLTLPHVMTRKVTSKIWLFCCCFSRIRWNKKREKLLVQGANSLQTPQSVQCNTCVAVVVFGGNKRQLILPPIPGRLVDYKIIDSGSTNLYDVSVFKTRHRNSRIKNFVILRIMNHMYQPAKFCHWAEFCLINICSFFTRI